MKPWYVDTWGLLFAIVIILGSVIGLIWRGEYGPSLWVCLSMLVIDVFALAAQLYSRKVYAREMRELDGYTEALRKRYFGGDDGRDGSM